MKRISPPSWADRFLAWYCNPDILEEIQGDAHELYAERLTKEGKRKADLKFVIDVIRFFRWSNIRRTDREFKAQNIVSLLRFNLKISTRNAAKNKLSFIIKTMGLSFCLAFTLILTAFVLHEKTYDHFNVDHERIYRITSLVNFQDHKTHYAVTPLPIGKTMTQGIPEVESYTRLMFEGNPLFHIGDHEFYNQSTLAADSNFLRMLTFEFIHGGADALDEPNNLVLTESTAKAFFGDQDPMGQSLQWGNGPLVSVAGVIKDPPTNSHLRFDILVSWNTFNRQDEWSNLNAYTYVILKPGADIKQVGDKMPSLLRTFHELVAREYDATYEPIFENITDIHLSETLDEDIAIKRKENNLSVLIAVVLLFLITGLINYLNLTMAEITANLKKIGIIRVFGGMSGSHHKIFLADTLFALLIVVPTSTIIFYGIWTACQSYLSIEIDPGVFVHPWFIGLAAGFLVAILCSSGFNSIVLSNAMHVVHSLKGSLSTKLRGTPVRKLLVGTQVAFSTIMMALMIIVVDQFRFIQETDKGFDDKNTMVVKIRSGDPFTVEAFKERIRNIAGVTGVDGSSYYPGIIETKYVFKVETETGMKELLVPMMLCGYDYFKTLNIRLASGRFFDPARETDRDGAFIINETAAKDFGWNDAIGKMIKGPVGGGGDVFRDGNVIGVVQDFNFASLHARIEPMIIFLSDDRWGTPFIYIKTNPLHADGLVTAIEVEYKALWSDPFDWVYLDSKYLSLYKKDYEMKNIFEIGLAISIVLSSLGIFSISALLANLRMKEMGIRKVVGANFLQLFFLHIKSFQRFLVIAIPVAWPCTLYLSQRWLTNFAYHIDLKPVHFLFPALLAAAIVLSTSAYHAAKGALLNPVESLKHE
jgi:putative ABC transport system permease protein